jgi:hypothetical protein
VPLPLEEISAGIARGLVRGAIDGLSANADRLPALASAIVEGVRGVNTDKAVESKPDPAEQKDLQDALQDAIDSGAVARP